MLARPRYRSKRLREFFQCPPYVLFRKFQSKRHHDMNGTDGVILIAHKLPQNFVLIVMCDLFLAEAVAKQRLTRLFSISIGREGRYDMPRRTKSTERPWETRLRRFLHLHSPRQRLADSFRPQVRISTRQGYSKSVSVCPLNTSSSARNQSSKSRP